MAWQRADRTENPTLKGMRASTLSHCSQGAFPLLRSLVFCAALLFSWQTAAQQQLPKQADLHFEQGMQFLKQQNWQAAASEFREAIKINPKRAQAHNMLGQALEKLGERE